jgi:hypothetical protein
MKKFFKSVFSEADGNGSWSRMQSAIALVAVLSWVTFIVIKTKALPDLTSATIFISSSYVANRISRFLKKDGDPVAASPDTDTQS